MFLTDALALSHVPRWAIVRHSRPQSVADHSYRVAIIARELVRRLNWENRDGLDVNRLVWLALIHDLDESLTGDIPTPAKRLLGLDNPILPHLAGVYGVEGMTPAERGVLALADIIEAYTYLGGKQGGGFEGRHRDRVMIGLTPVLTECIRMTANREGNEAPTAERTIWQLITDINEEAGR